MFMVQHPHRFSLAPFMLCTLAFALLLTACGFGGGGTTATKPTPTPTPAAPTLTAYTGDGYTISYPQGWKVTKSNAGVTFTDPNGIAYVAVRTSPNPNAFISSDSLVTVGLDTFKSQAKNYQKQSVSPTTTIAGDTWSQ